MANEIAWWWSIRRAFEIPDLVSESGALDVIVAQLIQETAPNALLDPAREAARTIVHQFCALGTAGRLDGFLTSNEVDEDSLFNRLTAGNTGLFFEHRSMIDAFMGRVLPWVRKNPLLPPDLRSTALPSALQD